MTGVQTCALPILPGVEYDIVGVDPLTGEVAGLSIPTGMSLTLYGMEGDEPAQLNLKREFIFKGTHGYFRMLNIDINDAGAQYMFNQGTAASIVEIKFTNCNFNDFARNIVRCKDQASITIDELKFDNCVITNQGGGNYPIIGLDAKEYTVSNIEFNDCTFNTIKHNGIALYNSGRGLASVNTITFNDCTLYNAIGSGRYIVDSGSTSQGPVVTFNNTIIGKTNVATLTDGVWSSKSKGVRSSSVISNNSYRLADGVFDSNDIKTLIDFNADSDAVFGNPANDDFTIKDRNFPEGVGATRWYAN